LSLLFCHLLADYPLQTDAMVQAKKHLPGLTLHVVVHLVTMLVVVLGILRLDWRTGLPPVLAVTVFHFAIDTWKNIFSKYKPQWVIGGYLQDQVLHVASLLWVADWFAGARLAAPAWTIYGSGYILVTHAWFVTERVLTYHNKTRQTLVNAQLWPRMVSRAMLFTLLLLGWRQFGANGLAAAFVFTWPYGAKEDGSRFFVTDLVVAVVVMLFMLVAQYI
jgi:hypothetical protein